MIHKHLTFQLAVLRIPLYSKVDVDQDNLSAVKMK